MIYTKDFAFLHIPKTSGTSIKKSIAKNCLDAKYMPEDMFSETINDIDWRQVMHYSIQIGNLFFFFFFFN